MCSLKGEIMYTLAQLMNPKVFARFERLQACLDPKCCVCHESFTDADRQSEEIMQTKNGPAHKGCNSMALVKLHGEPMITTPGLRRG